MVGLISNVFAVSVVRKWHGKLAKIQKATGRQRRLTQCVITVNTPSVKEITCHSLHTVGAVSAETELIIRLLITSRVSGCAKRNSFCDYGNVLAEFVKPYSRIVACGTRTDYDNVVTKDIHHSLLIWNPPSTLTDCPVT